MLIPDFGPGFGDAGSVVRDVAGRIEPRNGAVVVVINRTSRDLSFSAFDHDSGGFGVDAPDTAVPAGAASVFSVVSGLLTGVVGWVNYEISGCDTVAAVWWNVPAVGSNECGANVRGDREIAFTRIGIPTRGWNSPQFIELHQVKDPNLVRSVHYGWSALEGFIFAPIPGSVLRPPGVGEDFMQLDRFWSTGRNDNYTTADQEFISRTPPLYRSSGIEGWIKQPVGEAPVGMVPLHTWYSTTRHEHVTMSKREFTNPLRETFEPAYRWVRREGFIFDPDRPQPPGTIPLHRWWSSRRQDNVTLADPHWRP